MLIGHLYLLWRNVYSNHFPIFLTGLSLCCCCWVLGVLYIFCILVLYQIYGFQFFCHSVYGLSFYSIHTVLWCIEVFWVFFFWCSPIYQFFLVTYSFIVFSKKSLANPMSWSTSGFYFLTSFSSWFSNFYFLA